MYHDVRHALAVSDPSSSSAINTELALSGPEEWNQQILITSAGAESRKIVKPTVPGQRIVLVATSLAGAVTIQTIGAQDFDGTNTTLNLAATGDWAILEALQISGVIKWRVTAKTTGATLSA